MLTGLAGPPERRSGLLWTGLDSGQGQPSREALYGLSKTQTKGAHETGSAGTESAAEGSGARGGSRTATAGREWGGRACEWLRVPASSRGSRGADGRAAGLPFPTPGGPGKRGPRGTGLWPSRREAEAADGTVRFVGGPGGLGAGRVVPGRGRGLPGGAGQLASSGACGLAGAGGRGLRLLSVCRPFLLPPVSARGRFPGGPAVSVRVSPASAVGVAHTRGAAGNAGREAAPPPRGARLGGAGPGRGGASHSLGGRLGGASSRANAEAAPGAGRGRLRADQ